jgi:hypothetical protein
MKLRHISILLVEINAIKGWQVSQTIDALQVLFVDLLQMEWAKRFSWYEFSDSMQQLPLNHPTIARSQVFDASKNEAGVENNVKLLFHDVFEETKLTWIPITVNREKHQLINNLKQEHAL